MKELRDKMDSMPRSYDREALWESIDKPKSRKKRRFLWIFLGAVLGIGILTCLYLSDRKDAELVLSESVPSFEVQEKATRTSQQIEANVPITTDTKVESVVYKTESKALADVAQEATSMVVPNNSESNRLHKSKKSTQASAQRSIIDNKKSLQRSTYPPARRTQKDNPISQGSIEPKARIQDAEPKVDQIMDIEPIALLPLSTLQALEAKGTRYIPQHIVIRQAPDLLLKHAMYLQFGAGIHRSTFASTASQQADSRTKLEIPQVDFYAGIGYDRTIYGKLFFTSGLEYSILKEKIQTSVVEQSSLRYAKLHYRLYNHYHFLTGRLGLGTWADTKYGRFDLAGGIRLDILKSYDVDYFVDASTLASADVKNALYADLPSVYAYGRVGYSLYFGTSYFIGANYEWNTSRIVARDQDEAFHTFQHSGIRIRLGKRF